MHIEGGLRPQTLYRGFAPGLLSPRRTPCTGRPPHILCQVYAPGGNYRQGEL